MSTETCQQTTKQQDDLYIIIDAFNKGLIVQHFRHCLAYRIHISYLKKKMTFKACISIESISTLAVQTIISLSA